MFAPWTAIADEPCLATVHFAYWLAWGGSLILIVVLAILMWTRWGHSRPLHKCAALSLLVHLLLAFLAMTVRIVAGDGAGGGGNGGSSPIHVRIVQETGKIDVASAAAKRAEPMAAPQLLAVPQTAEVSRSLAAKASPLIKTEKPLAIVEKSPAAPTQRTSNVTVTAPKLLEVPKSDVAVGSKPLTDMPKPVPQAAGPNMSQMKVASQPVMKRASPQLEIAHSEAPLAASIYALRSASNRLSLIQGQGGSAKTESAVVAALNWLAAAQSRDGRWSANQFGAGQEEYVLGQDRGGAGRNADTGITALALLAFLGAGHTHLQGQYHDSVQGGLDYLLRTQATDGSLFGDSTFYAQMYCHSMATFALAEAEAMSGDRRLDSAVIRAVNFSLGAQNAGSGGWRYRPGDSGDTSQLGWQVMGLASAKRAGIEIPDQTWNRIDRFLRSVRRGNFGGIAAYRPNGPASTSMTAEALYCHMVLEDISGLGLSQPAADEATNQILTSLPSADHVNLYYWYYATLALHGRQHASDSASIAWRSWNDAMTNALLSTQVTDGPDAGSWNTNSMWGGYGGRVYTTAMSALCLEVYYRYAVRDADGHQTVAARPRR